MGQNLVRDGGLSRLGGTLLCAIVGERGLSFLNYCKRMT